MARFAVLVCVVVGLGLALGVAACAPADPPIIGASWTAETMFEPCTEPCEPTSARRLEAAAGALGTRLVIAGGFSASMTEGLPITTEVLTYDTLTGQWNVPRETLPPAPRAWTHANLAAVGGSVYLLGGLDGLSFVAEGEAFVLEPNATEWTVIESLPAGQERGAAAIVVSTGHIFLLGGATESGPVDTILDFDIGTRTWSSSVTDPMRLPRLPTVRSHAAAMRTSDGTFIIAGGLEDNTTQRPLGDVYAMRPPTASRPAAMWELRESMQVSRGGCAYGVTFGQLICAGGEAGLEALDVVESYNPTPTVDAPGGIWTLLEPMPEPRAGARGVVVGDRLYVPGGSRTLEFEPTDSLFVFTPLPF